MRDRIFLDTNIIVYSSLQDDRERHNEALQFLEKVKGNIIFINTQVINEVYVSLLKHELKDKDIQDIISEVIAIYNNSIMTIETIKSAWNLRKKYNLSYWDSLIVASAMENECDVLYTEDMQDGQIIENRLRIVDPFEQ